MITAVDTNILLDLLIPSAPRMKESEADLTAALGDGSLVIGEAVYAELSAHFPGKAELDRFLLDTRIELSPSGAEALNEAGRAWSLYARRRPSALACPRCGARQNTRCEACGEPIRMRQHIVADFMIGAHALVHADRLLTRDRGYYRTYFSRLSLT